MDVEEMVRRGFSGTFTKLHGHGHVTVKFSVKNVRFTVLERRSEKECFDIIILTPTISNMVWA
jgi:hypothetical protein